MTSKIYRHTILLVEDDPLLAATMRRYLEKITGDVRCADTIAAAAAAWRDMRAGIILMDYRLPDGRGTDIVARMREEGRNDPVICLTGESEVVTPDLQQALRIHAVLSKPVVLEELRAAILALASHDDAAGGESRPQRVQRIGKYRRIVWHGAVRGNRVARLCRAAKDELWVVVELSAWKDADAAGWRGFCAWAGWLSSRGGRLCLLVGQPDLRQQAEVEVGDFLDVVADADALLFQGSRLTSAAERRQLLNALAVANMRGEQRE